MNDLIPLVTERDGVPVTTSRAVAEQFGKAHKDVLRAIETTVEQLSETEEGREFSRLNFELSNALDCRGKEQAGQGTPAQAPESIDQGEGMAIPYRPSEGVSEAQGGTAA